MFLLGTKTTYISYYTTLVNAATSYLSDEAVALTVKTLSECPSCLSHIHISLLQFHN